MPPARSALRCGARRRMRRAGAAGGKKRPGAPRGWGESARPGAQGAFGRRLPAIWEAGVPQDAVRRACPADRIAPMKWLNIKDCWY